MTPPSSVPPDPSRPSAGGTGAPARSATSRTAAPSSLLLPTEPPVPDATPWLAWERVPYRIHGTDVQAVEVLLHEGQRIIFQPRGFVCGIGIDQLHISWGDGLLDPIRRAWAGEEGILQQVVASQPASVVIGGDGFGRIVPVAITPERPLICQRGAFLGGLGEIDISIAFTRRLRAGFLGRQGAVFQRISGHGLVFLHAAGVVLDWVVPDERVVRVSTRNILAFDASVGYDLQFAGGALTLLLGTQGAFLSQLQGPGRMLIQTVDHGVLTDQTPHRSGRGGLHPLTRGRRADAPSSGGG